VALRNLEKSCDPIKNERCFEMTRTKKIIKKKLKKPDEFISFTEKAFMFITHHSKSIAIGGVIVLILLLSIFFYQRWEKANEGNANQMFSLALESYQITNVPSQEGSLQNHKNVLEKFNDVVTKFPNTLSGKLSMLYKGNLCLRLGEFEEAIKAYEAFLQKAGKERLYRSFAIEGLGYSYEGKKDYEKAIHAYQKIIELGENFQLGNAYLGMGRCYEKLGKEKETLENYKNFLKGSRKSSMTNIILKKLSYLEK
jgi:tetratricopeptide (TPR) repeat protein